MNLFIALLLLVVIAAAAILALTRSRDGEISASSSAVAAGDGSGNPAELVSAVITALASLAIFGISDSDDLWFVATAMMIAGAAILGVCTLREKRQGIAESNKPDQEDRLDIPAAVAWASAFGDDFSTAWHQCPKVEWLCYLAGYLNCNRKEMVLAVNDCIFYARDHPDLADIDDFPDTGQMFAWMVLNSEQFNSRTKQFNIVERWSRGAASVDDCRKAEVYASETAASIFPGGCQNGWEADEASVCQDMHDAIKYLLRAILVLEALQNEEVAPQSGVQNVGVEHGQVRVVFRTVSNDPDSETKAGREALFIFNLAMAAKYASFVMDSKTGSSQLASMVREQIAFS